MYEAPPDIKRRHTLTAKDRLRLLMIILIIVPFSYYIAYQCYYDAITNPFDFDKADTGFFSAIQYSFLFGGINSVVILVVFRMISKVELPKRVMALSCLSTPVLFVPICVLTQFLLQVLGIGGIPRHNNDVQVEYDLLALALMLILTTIFCLVFALYLYHRAERVRSLDPD